MDEIGRSVSCCVLAIMVGAYAMQEGTTAAQEPARREPVSPVEEQATVQVPEVHVRAQPVREGEKDFYISQDTTGSRMPMPLKDLPQSIQVVPQKIIQDQRVLFPNQVLRNISSIAADQPVYSEFQRYKVRGFDVTNFYKDGMLDIGFDRSYWLGNIDRVEVLKGPSSVLYGSADPGGLINYISKRPLAEPTFTALGSLGNFSFVEGLLDVSGPATKDKSVTYRIIGDYQDSNTFIDNFRNRGKFMSGVTDIRLGDNTMLTVRGEIRERVQDQFGRVGLPAFGTVIGPVGSLPISRNFNESYADRHNLGALIGVELEHRFNDTWSFKSWLRWTHFNYGQNRIVPRLALDNQTLNRDYFVTNASYEDYRTNNTLIAKFETLGIRHQLLLGLELSLQPISYRNQNGNLASINIFNPVYGAQPTNIALRNEQSIDINTAGPYIQDLITLLPNLKLMLGGRYDYIDRQLSDRVIGVNTSRQDTRFSPRVGLVYEPFEGIAFYAGYSTSFVPVSDITAIRTQSKLFAPEIGKQYEVGVKLDLGKRLTATVAGYELKRQNVLTTNPTDQTVSIAVGEQRSRGAEVDLTYKIIEGWNVLVAYAYTDAEVTKDNDIQIGNRPRNVPMHSGRLWSSYNVPAGPLAGLMVGAGLYAVDRRFGDTANSFTLPSYVTVDATASYSWNRYRASLRINNLLNKTYFESADSRNSVFPGVPFTVFGTIAATF